jgi:hypothetical protein
MGLSQPSESLDGVIINLYRVVITLFMVMLDFYLNKIQIYLKWVLGDGHEFHWKNILRYRYFKRPNKLQNNYTKRR